jgi:hypothetical protein
MSCAHIRGLATAFDKNLSVPRFERLDDDLLVSINGLPHGEQNGLAPGKQVRFPVGELAI